jgi:hypothetical protein
MLERKVSGTAMAFVLGAALLFGLIGFAFNTMWIVSIVLLALGLGYVVANARQDRREVTDQRLNDADGSGAIPDMVAGSTAGNARRRRIR